MLSVSVNSDCRCVGQAGCAAVFVAGCALSQSDHIDAALNNLTWIQHRCNPNPTRSWQWEEGIGPRQTDRAAVAKIMRVMTTQEHDRGRWQQRQ